MIGQLLSKAEHFARVQNHTHVFNVSSRMLYAAFIASCFPMLSCKIEAPSHRGKWFDSELMKLLLLSSALHNGEF